MLLLLRFGFLKCRFGSSCGKESAVGIESDSLPTNHVIIGRGWNKTDHRREREITRISTISPFPAGSSSPSRCGGGGAKIDFPPSRPVSSSPAFLRSVPSLPIFSTLFFFTHSGKGCLSISPNLVGAKKVIPDFAFSQFV